VRVAVLVTVGGGGSLSVIVTLIVAHC